MGDLLVVIDDLHTIFCGDDELMAFRRYSEAKGKKNIYRANIKWVDVLGTPFIESYEILEVIK